jgi:DNA polymerase alpha-associated DNA helicase A
LSRGDKVKVQGKSGGQDKSESKSAEAAAAAASNVNKVNIAAEAETVTEANGEDESDTLDRDPIDPTAGALSKLSVKSQSRSRLRPPRTLETTLFDRLESLYGEGIKRVLRVQYRMNEHIASFPSSELYDGALISAESVAQRTLRSLPTIEHPESEDAKDTLDPTVVFFDTNGCEFYERTEGEEEAGKQRGVSEGSKSNENEAEVVVTWAKKLVSGSGI